MPGAGSRFWTAAADEAGEQGVQRIGVSASGVVLVVIVVVVRLGVGHCRRRSSAPVQGPRGGAVAATQAAEIQSATVVV